MSKKCAREECGKTVYPLEELKCLDKIWHKGCFKCTVCGMTLTMKNYKGYDKMPYCEPHYPKTVASVVVDTPEMRRLAENTKLQSQVKYHAAFEKSKGHKIEVADDPEMARHLRNTKVQSQVAYHGEHDKKKLQDEIRPPAEQVEVTNGKVSLNPNNAPESPSTYAPPQVTTPYSSRLAKQSGTVIYSSDQGGKGLLSAAKAANGQTSNTTQSMNSPKTASTNDPKGAGFIVKAMYDYTAADKDEITFNEGDLIVNCQKVDDGWMTGTVQRTSQWGMLPANYVERVKQQTTGLHYLSKK